MLLCNAQKVTLDNTLINQILTHQAIKPFQNTYLQKCRLGMFIDNCINQVWM
jgi:hypothetical protein